MDSAHNGGEGAAAAMAAAITGAVAGGADDDLAAADATTGAGGGTGGGGPDGAGTAGSEIGAWIESSRRACSNDSPSAENDFLAGSSFRVRSLTVCSRSGSFRASVSAARYCASASPRLPRR